MVTCTKCNKGKLYSHDNDIRISYEKGAFIERREYCGNVMCDYTKKELQGKE